MTTTPTGSGPTTARADDDRPPWQLLTAGVAAPAEQPVRRARVLVQVAVAAVLVLVAVVVGAVVAARKLAEAEAVNDAARSADVLAEAVVQPALDDAVATGDPAALAAFDAVVRRQVLGPDVVRVKLWTPSGVVRYADEPALVGRQFPLGEEEREVFADPRTRAEVSDLTAPENELERGQGPLLEVYRPVWTETGSPLLFEIYYRYDEVSTRGAALFRGFAGVTISSVLLLVILLVPVVWRLVDRLQEGRRQREQLLERAVDASDAERRRIAGTLHDGVVQDLAAVSYLLAGSSQRAIAQGDRVLAAELDAAAGTVRGGIGSLRSLLVDIYPASLEQAGLAAALEDLAGTVRARGPVVRTRLADPSGLDAEGDRLVYRVARECLSNVVQHAGGRAVDLVLTVTPAATVLEIADDGAGFDLAAVLAAPPHGHFGLRVLLDTVEQAGARLHCSTAPGAGTAWRLEVPR